MLTFWFSESTRKLNISHTGPNHGLQNNCTSYLKRKQKPKTRSIKSHYYINNKWILTLQKLNKWNNLKWIQSRYTSLASKNEGRVNLRNGNFESTRLKVILFTKIYPFYLHHVFSFKHLLVQETFIIQFMECFFLIVWKFKLCKSRQILKLESYATGNTF